MLGRTLWIAAAAGTLGATLFLRSSRRALSSSIKKLPKIAVVSVVTGMQDQLTAALANLRSTPRFSGPAEDFQVFF